MTDADIAALKAAAERARDAADWLDQTGWEECCGGECLRPGACRDPHLDIIQYQEAANPAAILALIIRMLMPSLTRRKNWRPSMLALRHLPQKRERKMKP